MLSVDCYRSLLLLLVSLHADEFVVGGCYCYVLFMWCCVLLLGVCASSLVFAVGGMCGGVGCCLLLVRVAVCCC